MYTCKHYSTTTTCTLCLCSSHIYSPPGSSGNNNGQQASLDHEPTTCTLYNKKCTYVQIIVILFQEVVEIIINIKIRQLHVHCTYNHIIFILYLPRSWGNNNGQQASLRS